MAVNRLSVLFFSFAVAAVFYGCQRSRNDDAINEADSINAVKYKTMPALITIEKPDAEFVVLAAGISMDEIALGTLAQKKGQDRRIKNLGAVMVIDHNKLQDKIKTLANARHVTLPSRLGASELKLIGILTRKNGRDFDKAYIKNMTEDHKEDIKEFENILKKSFDPEVKALASKALPMLHTHLDAINTMYDAIK